MAGKTTVTDDTDAPDTVVAKAKPNRRRRNRNLISSPHDRPGRYAFSPSHANTEGISVEQLKELNHIPTSAA